MSRPQSRALIAAYALDFFGITKGKRIKVLDGGMAEWAREGRDVVELE